MTACPGCANPAGGIAVTSCRACRLREIARGPAFFASMRAGKLTPAYVEQLAGLGGTIEQAHAEVKAAAKTLSMGATPA